MKKKFLLFILFLLTLKFGYSQTKFDSLFAYPNPFDKIATIHFDIVNNDTVSLNIYDLTGKTVKTFFTNTLLPSGSYSINLFGDSLKEGIYFIRLEYGTNKTKSTKLFKQSSVSGVKNENLHKEDIFSFPNPSKDLITIPIDGSKNILITNLNGQILKTLKTDSKTISLSDLASGIYILNVFNENDRLLTTNKIVKE